MYYITSFFKHFNVAPLKVGFSALVMLTTLGMQELIEDALIHDDDRVHLLIASCAHVGSIQRFYCLWGPNKGEMNNKCEYRPFQLTNDQHLFIQIYLKWF